MQSAHVSQADTPVAHVVKQDVAAERLMAELERLQALPSVAIEVIQKVDDPNSSARDVETVVSKDPTVAARLFKLANSAFYARGNKVSTIGDAVKKLGFKTIRNLAVAASAGQALSRPMLRYPFDELGLWKHSLGVGIALRVAAGEFSDLAVVRDELFLGGLMHDVGKLVLDPILSELDDSGPLTPQRERALTGFDHSSVGLRIAETWNLPAHTADMIRMHHEIVPDHEHAKHAALVWVVDLLLNRAQLGLREVPTEVVPNPGALELLGLDATSLGELDIAVRAEIPEVLSLCDALQS
ncbi:MAG: HDOD domain-containing protein [Pseudomonadota bacterium]